MEGSPFQQTHFQARGRLLLMFATPVLAAAVLYALAVGKIDRIYEPGPVSTAHAIIGNECWRCHSENGLTGDWRAAYKEGTPSVPDKACTVCHAGPPHHEGHKQNPPAACADCHHEHRGRQLLVAVTDQHCVACHANLNDTLRTKGTFASSIHSFADHPEFALFDEQRHASGGAEHHISDAVEFLNGRMRDKATIRLNHAVHLNPKGIPGPDRKLQKLDCQRCHTTDAAGYMQPINYEAHCAECHRDKLNFDSQRFAGTPVPHGNAEAARGAMRQRYADFFLLHRELHDGSAPPAGTPDSESAEKKAQQQDATAPSLDRTIPRIQPPRLPAIGWTWVNEQVEKADLILFQQPQDGCRYCHTKVERVGQAWKVEPPHIPYRWYEHAKFRHDSHRLLTCTACHSQVEASKETGDVLLPRIASCRSCHTNNTAQPVAGSALSHCAECHDYHQDLGEKFDGPLSLDLQVGKPNHVREPPTKNSTDPSAEDESPASAEEAR